MASMWPAPSNMARAAAPLAGKWKAAGFASVVVAGVEAVRADVVLYLLHLLRRAPRVVVHRPLHELTGRREISHVQDIGHDQRRVQAHDWALVVAAAG